MLYHCDKAALAHGLPANVLLNWLMWSLAFGPGELSQHLLFLLQVSAMWTIRTKLATLP